MEHVLSWAFSLWCGNSKAFREHQFALQGQQPEKDKQNVHVAPFWKNFCGAHGYFHPFNKLRCMGNSG